MNMKEIDYSKNTQLHIKVQNKPVEWRLGQAYFNYAEELYPEETNQLRGTEYDCFYNDEKIPEFLEKLNEKSLEFKKANTNTTANTIEFEGKTFTVNGKGDEQFVNNKIQELRKTRNELQDKINELSKQLNQLEEERDYCQKEIDEEFLKQEHAYDLIGKCILYKTNVYHVKYVERLFDGIRIWSDWGYNIPSKHVYCSLKHTTCCTISFDELDVLLNNNDEKYKIIPMENALDTFKKYMQLVCETDVK